MALKYNIPEQNPAMAAEPAAVAYIAAPDSKMYHGCISVEDAMMSQPTAKQSQQLEAFWNLMQTSDESVQYGLYVLLNEKYSASRKNVTSPVKSHTSFRGMKGILAPADADMKILRDEYLREKYGM